MDWLSFGISVIAIGLAISAEVRSRRVDKRATAQAVREEVNFRVIECTRDGDRVTVKFVNDGHATPTFVSVAPESVLRVTLDSMSIWTSSPPGEVQAFSFIEPRLRLESLTLTWKGPGTGRQTLVIPAPDADAS